MLSKGYHRSVLNLLTVIIVTKLGILSITRLLPPLSTYLEDMFQPDI
jgi:hypothetical protein